MAGLTTNRKLNLEFPALEENNLVEFPLCYLADTFSKDLRTLTFEDTIVDRASGTTIARRVIISAADAFGLPNWWDQDVLLALMVLTSRKTRFKVRAVEFSLYELRKLLDVQHDGRYNKRVQESLDRWCGLTIKYENAWRRKDKWGTETFHIIDSVKLSKGRDWDPDDTQMFKWSDQVVESINSHNTKAFDWEFYKSLKSPTAKRLYRFLDKRFHHKGKWNFDGVELAVNKLGLARDQPAWRYKDRFKKAASELEQRGFLKRTKFKKEGKGRFQVYFEKVRTTSDVQSKQRANEPTELEILLSTRGIKNAAELCRKYPEQKIREQVENYDDRIRAGEKIGPGWLGSAIVHETGYGFRQGYKNKADRERDAQMKKTREDELRQQSEAYLEAEAREQELYDAKMARMDELLESLGKQKAREFEQEALKSCTNRIAIDMYHRSKAEGGTAFIAARKMILEEHFSKQWDGPEDFSVVDEELDSDLSRTE